MTPELQIITQKQFDRVTRGREQRSIEYEKRCETAWQRGIVLVDGTETVVKRPQRTCPKRNTGKALLSGNVFCGHCGGRIFATTAQKGHDAAVRVAIYNATTAPSIKRFAMVRPPIGQKKSIKSWRRCYGASLSGLSRSMKPNLFNSRCRTPLLSADKSFKDSKRSMQKPCGN